MKKKPVGYRFSPTGLELINHYLKNKILGKSWLVDHAISEVNICRYEPWFLPCKFISLSPSFIIDHLLISSLVAALSKLESKDLVWYFFSPKEYTSAKKNVTKRTTPSGYWKATGVDRKIKDRRGNGVEIGIKKTLVYYEGRVPNGVWTPWVLHEYHITSLPLNQVTLPQEFLFICFSQKLDLLSQLFFRLFYFSFYFYVVFLLWKSVLIQFLSHLFDEALIPL